MKFFRQKPKEDPIIFTGFHHACMNNDAQVIDKLLVDEDSCRKILSFMISDEKPVYHAIDQRYEQVCISIASKFPFTFNAIYRSWRENQPEMTDYGHFLPLILPFTDHQNGAQHAMEHDLIIEFEYLFEKFYQSQSRVDSEYSCQTIHAFICRACAATNTRFLAFILSQPSMQTYLYYGRFQDVPERPMTVALQNKISPLRVDFIKLLLLHDTSNLLFTSTIFECILNTQDVHFIAEILSLDRHQKCYQLTHTGNKSRVHAIFESSFDRCNHAICAVLIQDMVRCKAVYEVFSLLLTASDKKDISFLILLLEHGAGEWINHQATFHTKTEGVHSPLSYACYCNARPIVSLLLTSGAIIDGLELVEAVRSGDVELVSVILGHGGIQFVDKLDHRKHSSLSMACLTGNLSIVQTLLQVGASVVATRTLFDAVSSKNIDIVKAILRLPAGSKFIDGYSPSDTINRSSMSKRNPLEKACRMRCINIAQLLLDYGAKVQEVEFSLFYDCEAGDYALLRLLLENGANPGSVTGYHRRAQQYVLTAMEELGNSSLLTTGPLLLELLGEYDYLIRHDEPAYSRIKLFPPKVHLYGPTEQLEVINGFDRKTNTNSFTTYLEQGYDPEHVLSFVLTYHAKYPELAYPFFAAYVIMGWCDTLSPARIAVVFPQLKRLRLATFIRNDRVLFDILTALNVDFEWNEDFEREFKKAPHQLLSVMFPSTHPIIFTASSIALWLKAYAFCCKEWKLDCMRVLTNITPTLMFTYNQLTVIIVEIIKQFKNGMIVKRPEVMAECKVVLGQLKPWIHSSWLNQVTSEFNAVNSELASVLEKNKNNNKKK